MGTNTLTLSAVTEAYHNRKYRVIATNAYGSVTSAACTLSVTTANNSQVVAPSIVTPPASQTITQGTTTTLTVAASGDAPLSYQWEYSTDNGTTWTNVI